MSDYKTMPWSIKGVPESVRTIAKEQAAAAGMTMGAWLAQVISTAGGVTTPAVAPVTQENVAARAAENNNTAVAPVAVKAAEEASNAELGRLVLKVAKRLAVLENDTAQFGSAFQDQLSDLRKRVSVLENDAAIPASVSVAFSQV